jgi:DNA polymerase-3 subunit gamma/tau
MSNFVVSSLKYRPKDFESVVGQNHVTNTLKNSISENKIPSAILFCGPRGVGKTSCARIYAKEINKSSIENDENHDYSFNIFEIDAASNNKTDDIRDLIEKVRIPPQIGRYKVYIIDEVHMLSKQAENAFLKTLEEPPTHIVFTDFYCFTHWNSVISSFTPNFTIVSF